MFCITQRSPASFAKSEHCSIGCSVLTPLVARLRWVMMAAIVCSLLLTLCGQPASFWHDPTTAMRGDGQSIYAATNHAFDFFLGHGAVPFIATNLVYMMMAFCVVSRLPRTAALIAIFSMIFAHGYSATNWLVVRFHFGIGASPASYATLMGTLMSFAILPIWERPRTIIHAWRWIMVAAMFIDFTNTLIGQPASYWHDAAAQHEANALSRLFLGRGWIYYLGLNVILAVGEFVLVTILPLPIAFVCAFAFTFGSFVGASNWFFYEWRMGWIAPVAYGVILSTLMVWFAFQDGPRKEKAAS